MLDGRALSARTDFKKLSEANGSRSKTGKGQGLLNFCLYKTKGLKVWLASLGEGLQRAAYGHSKTEIRKWH